MRASMVFIGANPLQLDELAPDIAAQVERGALVVVVVRAIDARRLLKFAWMALTGAVIEAPEIEATPSTRSTTTPSSTTTTRSRGTPVAMASSALATR